MSETERVVEEDLVEDIFVWVGWLISEKKRTWVCQRTGMI